MKKIIWTLVGIILFLLAWWLISPLWRNLKKDDALPTSTLPISTTTTTAPTNLVPTEPRIVAQGSLLPKAHPVSGEVKVVKTDIADILRFENLMVTNGPDVRIYLSTDLSIENSVDLGAIRGTEGNVNYTIPAGTDITKYHYALIWCRTFHVLFSYADLK